MNRSPLLTSAMAALVLTASAIAQAPAPVGVADLSPQAEQAIDKALVYLAAHQRPDGSFCDKHDVAVASLSIMAFMVQGHQPEVGDYGPVIDRAINFLILKSRGGRGYMGQSMYEHALATLALSEAWGMSSRPDIRDTIKQAVRIIIAAQHATGGWRYKPQPIDHDLSVTAMQVTALASAQEAGVLVPVDVIDKAIAYVRSCRMPDGQFGYQPGKRPSPAMNAAAVMCFVLTGRRDDPAVAVALEHLRVQPDHALRKARFFFYTHYYAAQAMYQGGDELFSQWYPRIHDVLVSTQDPLGFWVDKEHGNEYATATGVLILGVPYRFLPIYQR